MVTSPGSIQSIAGQTHTYAPAAGGRVLAHPQIAGPSPQSLHLNGNEVAHVPSSDPQLAHAQGFAHPSTATALGAHAPAGFAAHPGGAVSARPGFAASFPGGASPVMRRSLAPFRARLRRVGALLQLQPWRLDPAREQLLWARRRRVHVLRLAELPPRRGGYHAPSSAGGSHYTGGGHSYGVAAGMPEAHGGGGHR